MKENVQLSQKDVTMQWRNALHILRFYVIIRCLGLPLFYGYGIYLSTSSEFSGCMQETTLKWICVSIECPLASRIIYQGTWENHGEWQNRSIWFTVCVSYVCRFELEIFKFFFVPWLRHIPLFVQLLSSFRCDIRICDSNRQMIIGSSAVS